MSVRERAAPSFAWAGNDVVDTSCKSRAASGNLGGAGSRREGVEASARVSEEQVFDAYVRSSSRWLLRSAWLLTGDWASAEDLVQQVLITVWRSWPTVSAARVPDSYVRTMLANAFLSSRRRVRWQREVITADPPDVVAVHASDGFDVERRHVVAAALAQLPPRQRLVVVLRYFCDLSIEQCAEALSCSSGTVKSQTSKALRRLADSSALRDLKEDIP